MKLTKSQLRLVAEAIIAHSCDAIDATDCGRWTDFWCTDCGMSHTREYLHFRAIDHHPCCTVGAMITLLDSPSCLHSTEELDHIVNAYILRSVDR